MIVSKTVDYLEQSLIFKSKYIKILFIVKYI